MFEFANHFVGCALGYGLGKVKKSRRILAEYVVDGGILDK
jgi:hypothetical protein